MAFDGIEIAPPARAVRPRRRRLGRHALLAALALAALSHRDDVRAQAPSPKLASVLQDVVQSSLREPALRPGTFRLTALPKSALDALAARQLRIDAAGNVQVYVVVTSTADANLQQLRAMGAVVEITDEAHGRVQVHVPVSRLDLLAALPFVTFVRPPSYAVRQAGAVTTEGDAILRSDLARQQFAVDGAGIRVGVLSDGLKGVFAGACTTCAGAANGPIATHDLPDATGTRNGAGVLTAATGGISGRSFQANSDLEGLPPASPPCGFPGAGAEGTALLEIVHDLAPGAQLSFANADTDLAFQNAVNFLAANNDVVVDDLGFFGEAGDGTSPVSSNTAAALNNPANRIRAYVTSVGNAADSHYLAGYADSGVDGTTISGVANTGHLHLFQPSADTTDVLGLGAQPFDTLLLPANGTVVVFLTWNDPFGGSGNNYDLYLVRQSTGAVVAHSTTSQTGKQDPVESFAYVNTTGADDFFRIVVQNVRNQAAARQLNLFAFAPECAVAGPRLLAAGRHERLNFNTASRSVPAQSDAGGAPASVISVGAICSGSAAAVNVFAGSSAPDESCNDGAHATAEFFSSRGPTLDGRTKPDVSAIDGVSVTGSGSFVNPFFGTSAAAPHVAAAAALTLQSAACLASGTSGALEAGTARQRLRTLILSNASPLSGAAPDNVFGAGLTDVFAAVQKTLPVFGGPSTLVIGGNTPTGATLTAAQLGFADPDQCPLTGLSWTGGCGSSPNSTLSCPFGPTSLRVSATNNGASFSPPAPIQITVTNFALGAQPGGATIAAGQSAQFQIALTPVGGPFPTGVSLACTNLPPGSACTFASSTVTPGEGGAQTVLTISTTARASASLRPGPRTSGPGPTILLVVGGILLAGIIWTVRPARVARRRIDRLLAPAGAVRLGGAATAMAMAAIAAVYVGCGGNNNKNPSPTSPAATLSTTSLAFGNTPLQTASSPRSVTLTNTGNGPLTITGVAASGDFAQTTTCGGSLAVNASCAVSVTFTPTASGVRTGTLTFTDDAPNSPQVVALSGTGTSQPGGTPAGLYQISVIGSSGNLIQSSVITLNVQ